MDNNNQTNITPYVDFINTEEEKIFNNFCTYISLLKGGNPNIANIFLNLLKNKYERNLFKKFLSIDSDIEMVNIFIKYFPQITKSKYIFKKLNKGNFYKK